MCQKGSSMEYMENLILCLTPECKEAQKCNNNLQVIPYLKLECFQTCPRHLFHEQTVEFPVHPSKHCWLQSD